MNRIDRYTSWLFFGYFIGALLVFVVLLIAVDAMSLMVSYKNVAGSIFMKYYMLLAPDLINKTVPVACLLGVVMTLTNLNKANELVALFASGMSLMRISRPLLLLVCGISVITYLASDRLLPSFARERNIVYYRDIANRPQYITAVRTDKIWYRSKNTIFNINTLDDNGKGASGLTMYFMNDNWDLAQMVSARRLEIKKNNWVLSRGTTTLFTADSAFPLTENFATKVLPMTEGADDLMSSAKTSDVLNQNELAHFIEKNKTAGLNTTPYEVEYHSKFGFAFAALVMCLLGIPFTVGRARSGGTLLNLGICIGFVFGYWTLYNSALTLGSHGVFSPIVAAWAPNFLMGGLGLFFIKRSKR